MSSIIVYGDSAPIGKKRVITKDTPPSPSNFYGDSKLQTEEGILPLQSDNFNVVVVRPPMIYGKGSKGNYPKLAKLARICPIFPDIENERSMLHIDNLCEFIRLMVIYEESGVFFPQNKEYVKTTDLVIQISKVHRNRIFTLKIFNILIYILGRRMKILMKMFGNQVYDTELSDYKNEVYCVRDFTQSIALTETKEYEGYNGAIS